MAEKNKPTPRFDRTSGAKINIVTEHAHIHRGKGYTFSTSFSIASGANADFLITAPQSQEVHLRVFEADTTGAPCDVTLYEGPFTVENSGSQVDPVNLNRNSSNVSSTFISKTASVTLNNSLTTQLEYHLINGAKQSGGSTPNATNEIDLENATPLQNLFRITNNSGGSVSAGVFFFWYE